MISDADKARFESLAHATLYRLATDAHIPVPTPKILWNIKGHSLTGEAIGNSIIRLHPQVAELTGAAYASTVIHEACHIHVTALQIHHGIFNRHGKWSAHGQVWRESMRTVGMKPERCSNLSADVWKQIPPGRVVSRTTYVCDCREHELTKQRERQVTLLYCRSCGSGLRMKDSGRIAALQGMVGS